MFVGKCKKLIDYCHPCLSVSTFCNVDIRRDARHMAKDVHDALEQVIHKHGNLSENEAEDFIKKLHSKGKYSVDVWS